MGHVCGVSRVLPYIYRALVLSGPQPGDIFWELSYVTVIGKDRRRTAGGSFMISLIPKLFRERGLPIEITTFWGAWPIGSWI